MTLQTPLGNCFGATADTGGARLATGWLRRTIAVLVVFWAAAVLVPQVLGFGGPWRAFGAGLIVPGAGLLYAIPATHHPFGPSMVLGHAVVIAAEIAAGSWLLRRFGWYAAASVVVGVSLLIFGGIAAPAAIVIAGHVAGFVGVLIACGWAIGIRLLGRADSVTLVAIIVASAAAGAALTAAHGDMPGPLTSVPWVAFVLALAATTAMTVRSQRQRRIAQRISAGRLEYLNQQRAVQNPPTRVSVVALRRPASMPEVTEARPDQLRHLRFLLGIAAQPADQWDCFDDEAAGPNRVYRYQVNALGWALATYNYSHTPSFAGVLRAAQLALFERTQQKAVWGYWYWQNLLGNWDFLKRRADPIDVPQNIMFTGYLNLQLAMFRQATGDARFDAPEALVFDWSPRQRFAYDHQTINAIAVRNFNQDLCLWPCEPIVSPGRTRGFVFPYCNAVTLGGVAMMDAVNGTTLAVDIAKNVERVLDREFTVAVNHLAAFMLSGLGLSVRRISRHPTLTALVVAHLAPLCPELAWQAWEILKRDWLVSGKYLVPGSAGGAIPDWGTGAKTNAEPLAAAMLLADSCGAHEWHAELWDAAVEQLEFSAEAANPGVWSFSDASVHANGMLGFAGLGRPFAFSDMLTKPRPKQWQDGPRLAEAPHPEVLVAKAVSDGHGLDVVLFPGETGHRTGLRFDQLRPGREYVAHGAISPRVTADMAGTAQVAVDLTGRTTIELRPI
ncbi:hypothetical protein [Mycobacterium sp. URHB0044]|uniref:linalool dehydratase/isomerase domain-containing protein n=1 Tax=Mycobacterium sp. URHB0044 TaxID=1380386 RepID=UPI000AE2DAFD|nr:hypothetical protein [Mycobacterium sp. URHB0044]